jgi:hypothetical protein
LGTKGGEEARERIRSKLKRDQDEETLKLNRILELTAYQNPLHAMNLEKLLRKSWNEESSSYVVVSRIQNRMQERKLQDLINNRYNL